MNKELQEIQKQSADILGDYPEKRAELAQKLTDAEGQQRSAKAAMDTAEDLDSYDKAAEDLKRADLAAKFARKALNKLNAEPRMNEADYMRALNTCKGIMDTAARNYRAKAEVLMDQLKALRDEYLQLAEDTNSTLVKLDDAANVLQSKYPYRVIHYLGLPDEKKPDDQAWLSYALRYEGYTACTLATTAENAADPAHKRDSVLIAAWGAVDRGYPRKCF